MFSELLSGKACGGFVKFAVVLPIEMHFAPHIGQSFSGLYIGEIQLSQNEFTQVSHLYDGSLPV
ncbi:MAG TPA: hypothetical protein PKY59_04550 [Pyrinomonadaceae bacterium]|nr:hypothetical protein [Pyrinomonadaceae bacterium]